MTNKLIDNVTTVGQHADGLFRKTKQDIPDSFLSDLADQRSAGGYTNSGEMLKMASIPVVVCEHMLEKASMYTRRQ